MVDFNVGGVAISADGVDWCEARGLLDLMSDAMTHFDIDIGAAVSAARIAFSSAFQIRICLYDNMPAVRDGIFLSGVALEGLLAGPVFCQPMDDDKANPDVLDASGGGRNDTSKDDWGSQMQKPLECMAIPIRNNTSRKALVVDPFLGSGTTLIAAEDLGRRCYGMEIDPRYVDMIVRRWEAWTDRASVLEGDGRRFEEIAAERASAA